MDEERPAVRFIVRKLRARQSPFLATRWVLAVDDRKSDHLRVAGYYFSQRSAIRQMDHLIKEYMFGVNPQPADFAETEQQAADKIAAEFGHKLKELMNP